MKHLKHLFTALLLLFSVAVNAHDFEVNGIYYNITDESNKTVEVTYRGNSYSAYSNEYTGNVEIPESVAYNGNTYSVTSIGERVFWYCSGLTSVVIPTSVTSIGDWAFYCCFGLACIEIPDGVTSIGEYAFSFCSGLTSVVIGNSVTSIGSYAFYECSGLTSVVIGNSVTSIGEDAFSGCSGLTSIEIPNSVTSIGNYAFHGCDNLRIVYNKSSLDIIAGTEEHGYVAAYANAVVKLGDTLENVGDYTFYTTNNLTTLVGYTGNDSIISLPPNYNGKNYTIGAYAFSNCTGLTSVIIPNSITSIENNVFKNCTSLAYVEIPNSVTSIGNSAFHGCSGLTSVVIPNSVTSIGSDAFSYCSGLTSIEIPNSVTSIGRYAFFCCSGLTSVVIGNSVTSIGERGFYGCSGLTAVHISDLSAWCNIDFADIESNPLCYKAENLYLNGELVTELVIPNDVTEIKKYAFSYCSGLTSVTIGNSVTSIGRYAFYNCSGLTGVTIGNSVTSIESYAFEGCSGLTNIVIPNSVTSIGSCAFRACSGLTSVEIPNSVTSIESYVFDGCSGLTSVVIPNSVTSIGDHAFYGCTSLNAIINFSNLTFTKRATNYGHIAHYANVVVNAPNGSIEGDFIFGIYNGVNTLAFCSSVSSLCTDWTSTNKSRESSSSKTYTISAKEGDSISFDWMVSSEKGWDELVVTINNTRVLTESGENTGEFIYTFPSDGVYTMTAWYIKDDDGSAGQDCAKIYNIVFSGATTVDVALPNSYKGEDYVIGAEIFKSSNLGNITIPATVIGVGEKAFYGCTGLVGIVSDILAENLFVPGADAFTGVDKATCTLHVPVGAKEAYATTAGWNEFTNIVELVPSEVTVTVNQYGSATYCSPYALDFSNVAGLKAYSATGYNTVTQVVTLTRVQTVKEGLGLFLIAEPGEYTVPVIGESNDYTLNMLVGTLESTAVNGTSDDGNYINFKYTVKEDGSPMFYQFEDGSTLGANKAYLQLPASLYPATASKSVNVRFDDGTTTDIEEMGEEGVLDIYDLGGRKLNGITEKGIYIINGKRVFVDKLF